MSSISATLKNKIYHPIKELKKKIFGSNNERLDFLMDSMSKLSASQRNTVIIAAVSSVVLFVILAIVIYFSQVSALNEELNDSNRFKNELERLVVNLETKKRSFDMLKTRVNSTVQTLKIKPFFETQAKKNDVQIESLNQKTTVLSPDNLLSQEFQEVKAEMRLNKISLPRLIKFLAAIENSKKFLTIDEVRIDSRLGDKLYFDSKVRFKGYERK